MPATAPPSNTAASAFHPVFISFSEAALSGIMAGTMSAFWRQTRVLVRRNFKIKSRKLKETLQASARPAVVDAALSRAPL